MSWRDGESSQHVVSDESDASSEKPMDPPGAKTDDDENDIGIWHPQDTPSVLEFRHTVREYSSKRESGCKKAEYSEIVTDEKGNRWRLILYVNGNGRASNHHLSLFLQVAQAEELPFGWKKTVSYVLTLEHPDALCNYMKRNPDKTFKMCPKAIDWGWSQFISSDRIQQEGFVQNDSIVISAHVTVKSSDTIIASTEDAELYLKCAVEEGTPDNIQLCLDQGASINCQFKDDLYTPLHTACSSNAEMSVLEHILEKGANVDAVNKWKETPLLIAANNGHTIAVELLLKHGSNPSLCSEAGWSALTFAAHKGYNDIVALLLRAGAPVNTPVAEDSSTPLHKACAGTKSGHSKSVVLLLRAGADVHWFNKWRETPLLTAANHGHTKAVSALLEHHADPCKCTDTGWSPLSIAAYKGHNECVRLLLEDGAPTEEDDTTLSALLQAATKGLTETVEMLLLHGADHTVTTKKGDTSLSILVEQNLIDCAVEMVAQYGASIARCSRDRKKVQRARLLINLRMKQQAKDEHSSESDESDGGSEDRTAQHHESSVVIEDGGVSAEEKARAAEEALLLELAKEDEQAKREEAKANSKQAKKKKKKERERQQRMKEEEERRKAKLKEAEERDRIKREKEAQRRREREERFKAHEVEEQRMVNQDVGSLEEAQPGWEESAREKRERARKQEQTPRSSLSPVAIKITAKPTKAAKTKATKAATDPTPLRKIVAPKHVKKPMVPLAGNRRWETNSPSVPNISDQQQPQQAPKPPLHVGAESRAAPFSTPMLTVEHPEVARFRQEKFVELLRRCDQAHRINDISLKRAIYRWIVRASHDDSQYHDPLIPSWLDTSQLAAFFTRQFIAEERKLANGSIMNLNMERLKEAGTWVASLCISLGVRVAEYAQQASLRLSDIWNDEALGTTASGPMNGTGFYTRLSFGNRVHSSIPTSTLNSLRQRHKGRADRFLTHALVANLRYETLQLLIGETDLDLSLLPRTQNLFSRELLVSGELWSSPFLASPDSVFWGRFPDVDALFDGLPPFGAGPNELDDILVRHGGSILACMPSDAHLAAKYTKRIVDSLAEADRNAVPLSFALFARAECLPDMPETLADKDLQLLDARLGRQHHGLVSRVFVLEAGQHLFCLNDMNRSQVVSPSPTLFVLLQNESGRSQFPFSDDVLSQITASMALNPPTFTEMSVPASIGIATEFPAQFQDSPVAGFNDLVDPISPEPQRSIRSGFGAIGDNTSISSQFSPSNESFGLAQRRGLLFDLIDNPADDELDNDIVSGMLSNLDAGLFQDVNVRSETVDIEAISLMGIGSGDVQLQHPFQRSSD